MKHIYKAGRNFILFHDMSIEFALFHDPMGVSPKLKIAVFLIKMVRSNAN